MKKKALCFGAGLVAVAVLGTACGSSDSGGAAASSDKSPTTTSMQHGEAASVTDGAATLRAQLTALLEEHVYLAGTAIATAVAKGGKMDDPAVKSAVATLDENSVALSNAIGSVYGDAGGQQFLELWRKHIGFFVDYTLGGATGDKAKQQKAASDLDGYRNDFGAFLESATKGGLTKQAVADELKPHVATLTTAIDAVLAGSPDVFPKLRTAAGHMPMTAEVLAGAIAAQFPDKFGS